MESYAAAFDAWKSAHFRLESAIQEYLDACLTLRDVFTVPSLSASSDEFRETKLIELELKLQLFPSYAEAISKSQNCLRLARNTSRKLSPISMLPFDLLHVILWHTVQIGMTKHYPDIPRPRRTDLITLSGVCGAWRQLMLYSSTFWTSLELVIAGTAVVPYYELARLWTERSLDAPLDLLLYGFRDSWEPRDSSYDHITIVSDFLTTLLPRVRTLNLRASHNLNDVLYPVLYRWATYGTRGAAQWLHACEDYYGQDLDDAYLESIIASTYTDTRPHNFIEFFHSLRRLIVHDPLSGSNLPIHAGLVELRLNGCDNWMPTFWDIHQVLLAAPRLCVLYLINMFDLEPSGEPDAVPLDHLKTLTLHGHNIWQILGFITSTSKGIKVHLPLEDGPRYCSTVQSFLACSNISHLDLDFGLSRTPALPVILSYMPCLQAFALRGFGRPDPGWSTAQMFSTNIWPALSEIYLIGFDLTLQMLAQLISIHVPRTIHLVPLSTDPTSHSAIEEFLLGHGVRVVQTGLEEAGFLDLWE